MVTSVSQIIDTLPVSGESNHSSWAVEIVQHSPRWESVGEVEKCIHAAAAVVADNAPLKAQTGQSVSIVLADDSQVRALNLAHRKQDKPTNVLSFPSLGDSIAPEPDNVSYLGDVVLAYETIVAEAEDLKRSTNDHLSHLVIHGLLHLLGYDHQTDDEAGVMEKLEITLLSKLEIADPYRIQD